MGLKSVDITRFFLFLALATCCFGFKAQNAFAEVVAIPTCKLCTEDPCTDYCETPPCAECTGDEGDSFIFFGGNSTGPAGLNYVWDIRWIDNIPYYLNGQTVVKQFFNPHTPAAHPDGWPATLTVDKSGEYDTSDPLNIKINNVEPTAIVYVFDISNNVQYEAANVFVGHTITFHTEQSYDVAEKNKLCAPGNHCGIEDPEIDFSYDQVGFNSEYTGRNPTKVWQTPGYYWVRVKITDDDVPPSYSYTDIMIHAIEMGPYVELEAQPESFTEGERVVFTANQTIELTNPIVSYEWDFDYVPANGFNTMGTGETIYYRFPDSREKPSEEPYEPYYNVAVKVTDSANDTYVAERKFYPDNIPPVAVLELKTMEDVKLIPTEYITINPDTPEAEGIPVYEFNEGQLIKYDSMKSYAGCLEDSPLNDECDPENGRYAPDEEPPVTSNAPGYVTGVQWDWNFGESFLPSPEDISRIETHAYNEDTDQNIVPGEPIVIMLRVIDDDNKAENPSDDFIQVFVRVLDIEPIAEIRLCNELGTICNKPDAPIELQEGIAALFKAADISDNTDTVTLVEWDFDYSGNPEEFNTEATTTSITETTEHFWLQVGTPTLAVRLTDDDGKQSIGTQSMNITDMPPTAIITPNDGSVIQVNEGDTVTFYADTSLKAPGDSFTRFRWDDDYTPNSFAPDARWDYESNCESGFCSRFTSQSCEGGAFPDNDCPIGRNSLVQAIGDGPSTKYIALCVEDADTWELGDDPENMGLCVQNQTPTDPNVYPRIATLEIQVQNVAPVFVTTPSTIVNENQPFEWLPEIYDPMWSGDSNPDLTKSDNYYFTCEKDNGNKMPLDMECNTSTGFLLWTPGPEDVSWPPDNENPINLEHTVCDDDGGCTTYKGTIYVQNVNDPAIITGYSGDTVVPIGDEAVISISATDPDLPSGTEHLIYYICTDDSAYYTADMRIDNNGIGIFRWFPSADDYGNKNVKICVRDDECQGDPSVCNDCQECITVPFQISDANNIPEVSLPADFDTEAGYVCVEGDYVQPNGNPTWTYIWRQTSIGTGLCIENLGVYPDKPLACFATSAHGEYTLGLKADNGSNFSQEKSITITLNNTQPGAIVQGHRNYDLGSFIDLDGSSSKDYNINDTITYQWTDNPPILELAEKTKKDPTFNVPEENGIGLYRFDLTVTDTRGLESPENYATVGIETIDISDNGDIVKAIPFAIFESKICQSAEECELTDVTIPKTQQTFLLDASDSISRTSEGGKAGLSYTWKYLEDGPDDPLMDSPNEDYILEVSAFKAGAYSFELTVTDTAGTSRPFVKTVLVADDDNIPPIAKAGDDIINKTIKVQCGSPTTKYALVELDGSNSLDPDGQTLLYSWVQTAGIIVPLQNADTATPSFLAFKPGLYSFKLTVNDEKVDSLPDTIHVSVASENGSIPTTTIDYDRISNGIYLADPGEEITLDASNSGSLTSNSIFFDWYQTGGPSVVLSNWEEDVVSFKPDINGAVYSFRLIVMDDEGNWSIPRDISISVLSQANRPPVCEVAESSINTSVGEIVELDASSTTDPDNNTMTYLWTQNIIADEEELTITNANQAIATITPEVAGTFEFEFVANDGIESCSPVSVTVTVSPNGRPTANAGEDQSVCLGDTVQLNGSSSEDPDQHELEYIWSVEDDGGTGLTENELSPSNAVVDPTFETVNPGVITLSLVVSDGFEGGSSESDSVQITIRQSCEDGDQEVDQTDGDEDTDKPVDGDTDSDEGSGGGCQSTSDSYVPIIFAGLFILLTAGFIRRKRLQ